MASKQPIDFDDGWDSNTNEKCGWCEDGGKCDCSDVNKTMYDSQKYDSFLEIENNYFEAWADHKILPHEALAKFFKCIELCDNYNQKYSKNPEERDPKYELKLLRYHYNSLKYCVETQYILKKYNKNNSYSLLIYGFIRNIIENDFDDDDEYILIPLALVNLIVVFYDELITNYSQLLQLSLSIQNTYHTQSDIEFITLNAIRNRRNMINNTITFITIYVEYHEQKNNYFQSKVVRNGSSSSNKKENELAQLYWNTIIFCQMNNIHLWFKYAVLLTELYMKLSQYQKSKEIMQFIADQQLQQRQENRHIAAVIVSKYYSCKIEQILIDIAREWTGSLYIDGATKSKLMDIYNESRSHCQGFHGIYFYYFKIFLLFRDYEKAEQYLADAMEKYYGYQDNHQYIRNIDQLFFEYGLILYVIMNGLDEWDENAFHLTMSDRFPSRYHVGFALSSRYKFFMAKYDYEQQVKLFVECVLDEDNTLKQLLLPFNSRRTKIDTFLMERCIKIIRET